MNDEQQKLIIHALCKQNMSEPEGIVAISLLDSFSFKYQIQLLKAMEYRGNGHLVVERLKKYNDFQRNLYYQSE